MPPLDDPESQLPLPRRERVWVEKSWLLQLVELTLKLLLLLAKLALHFVLDLLQILLHLCLFRSDDFYFDVGVFSQLEFDLVLLFLLFQLGLHFLSNKPEPLVVFTSLRRRRD